jgi:hypothetical protein
MGATITYDEVATLVGVNIPLLDLRSNFERIQVLCCHFEEHCNTSHAPKAPSMGERAW